MLHKCFPAGYLHPVATVPGVALCLSYPPPPPIDFFYRISQLLCRFVLCRFHLSFGLGLQDDFNVWRSANTPKLKVKLRLSMNRDPINHVVAAIKEEIPLWSNQSQENSKSSRIAYLEVWPETSIPPRPAFS